MLSIVSPLTKVAKDRIEAVQKKINKSEEELNPNMKFADNALAKLLDEDMDFNKLISKKKLSWDQYDILLKKVMTSVASKPYYAEYMASPERSLKEDCKLFTKIFEEEFVDSEELEMILEEKSLHWNDDLAYALTWCCRTLKSFADGEAWKMALTLRTAIPLAVGAFVIMFVGIAILCHTFGKDAEHKGIKNAIEVLPFIVVVGIIFDVVVLLS
jgi:N utilization substance protein B